MSAQDSRRGSTQPRRADKAPAAVDRASHASATAGALSIALNNLLTAPNGLIRTFAHADLVAAMPAQRNLAIWDGVCGHVLPLGRLYACLTSDTTRSHTPDTCRWATADDLPRHPGLRLINETEETL